MQAPALRLSFPVGRAASTNKRNQSAMTKLSPFWETWLKWLLANTIAWLVAFGVVTSLDAAPVVFGLLIGVILSVAQGSVVKQEIAWRWWLLATTLGWLLGVVVSDLADQALIRTGALDIREIAFWSLLGAVGGAFSSILQFLLQWRRTHPGIKWFFAFTISGLIGGLLSGQTMWALLEIGFSFSGIVGGLALFWAITMGGVLFGLVTAFPVAHLLHPQQTRD